MLFCKDIATLLIGSSVGDATGFWLLRGTGGIYGVLMLWAAECTGSYYLAVGCVDLFSLSFGLLAYTLAVECHLQQHPFIAIEVQLTHSPILGHDFLLWFCAPYETS